MTPQEIEDVVRVTVEATQGRMPVVAGTGYNVAIGADIARRVERLGGHHFVLPPYYSGAPEAGLFEFLCVDRPGNTTSVDGLQP